MFSQLVNAASLAIGQLTASYLIPFMLLVFIACLAVKMLIYYLSKTQYKVIKEFEIRVHRHLDEGYEETKGLKFDKLTRVLLNKTWNDYFLMRKKNMRRKFDQTNSFLDRMFYIDSASKDLFEDTIKQTNYVDKELNPNFRSVSTFAFTTNTYFNHLFGILPIRMINQFLGLLPGLFIIGGIFGTFLGIVKGIPELKGLDPTNVDSARLVLNHFLDQMAFSMNTSIMGIFFSVFFTIVNSIFSPKSIQADAFEMYIHSLEFLYKNSKTGAESNTGNSSSGNGSSGAQQDESEFDEETVKLIIPELPTEEQRRADQTNRILKEREDDRSDESRPNVIVLNKDVPEVPVAAEEELEEAELVDVEEGEEEDDDYEYVYEDVEEPEEDYGEDEVNFEFDNDDEKAS